MVDLTTFFDALDEEQEDIWSERPVDLQTFLYSKEYAKLPRLSPIQEEIIELGSNILRRDTLVDLYGDERGDDIADRNRKELFFLLGKGSGKDFMSEIICMRIAYILLCLKDPAGYYGKPEGDAIDIVNVAKNAQQANNVFFSGLKQRLKYCAWFRNKYTPRKGDIEFEKNIHVYSLNSENEATEGLNILVAVLDELDSFDEGDTTENADKMYKTLRATVSSRFDDVGKVLVLSFPRRKDGFIMKKYNEFVVDKIVTEHKHIFVLNPELPPGTDGNEFSITWQEDEIVSYRYANVWALKAPTWRVNPTKTVDSFMMDFFADVNDSLGRFAACPQDTDGISDWCKDKSKIDATFKNPNGILEDGSIRIKPDPSKKYYIHVDLALVQDNAALALAHVEDFKSFRYGSTVLDPAPHVVVDLVRYWKPGPNRALDFSDIREFIISLRRLGFDIRLVTFDRWNSTNIISMLNEIGIRAEKLSVARDHYNEFLLAMVENRVVGPEEEKLKHELKTIIINEKGKVDHPGRTGNDLADAVCGAIFNAASLTPKDDTSGEIVTYADIRHTREEERRKSNEGMNRIYVPKQTMPADIASFLDGLKVL
jgi:hypothetical protein